MNSCLNCEKIEQEIPLLRLHFKSEDLSICPQCLPILFHKPANLAEKLTGMEPSELVEHV
jgi:hypothetical protein